MPANNGAIRNGCRVRPGTLVTANDAHDMRVRDSLYLDKNGKGTPCVARGYRTRAPTLPSNVRVHYVRDDYKRSRTTRRFILGYLNCFTAYAHGVIRFADDSPVYVPYRYSFFLFFEAIFICVFQIRFSFFRVLQHRGRPYFTCT